MKPLPTRWRKSSRSAEETNCVELACVDAVIGAVRDSKNPNRPMLGIDLARLLSAVKADRLNR